MVRTRSMTRFNAGSVGRTLGTLTRRYAGPVLRAGLNAGSQYMTNRIIGQVRGLRSGTRTIEPAPNTFQHDSQMRYRKKRMPPRKRKAWKRFTKKVRHVELQAQPLQIYTKEGVANLTSAANQAQVYSRICGGTTVFGNDEIQQIFQSCYNLGTVAACAPYKIYVKSICMDIQMTNTGSYPIIVDVYTIQCRSKYPYATDPAAHFVAAIGEVAAPSGGGSISSSKTAVTLFDAPNFCSYWKVLSKKEFIIGSNNSVTLQLRQPANRHIEGKELAASLQTMVGYKAFLFSWHGQPSNRGSSGSAQFDPTTVTFGYQTVVHYAVPPSSTTKEAGASV